MEVAEKRLEYGLAQPRYSLSTEIRHLPNEIKRKIAEILENVDHFDRFMLDIPKNITVDFKKTDNYERKYKPEHVKLIKGASDHHRRRRLNGEILFDEWGTSGRARPRLIHLITLLDKEDLQRASNELRTWIGLKEIDTTGSSVSELNLCNLTEDQVLREMNENLRLLLLSDVQDNSNGNLETILPIPELNAKRFQYAELKAKTNDFNEGVYTKFDSPGRCIGFGGFATVFLAKDLFEKIPFVAVKRLKINESPNYFLRELKTISEVNHPNIIKLLGYSADQKLCLVYEYAHNGPMKDHLKGTRGTYDFNNRVRNLLEVSAALLYLHNEKNLIHRDIKPGNILLDRPNYDSKGYCVAKLCDFGLLLETDENAQTRVVGTGRYMAPEQHYSVNTAAADIYAFGVVMLEALTGLSVFDKERADGEQFLREYVELRIDNKEKQHEIIPMIVGMPANSSCRLDLIEYSLKCVKKEKSDRPQTKEVYETLLKKCNTL